MKQIQADKDEINGRMIEKIQSFLRRVLFSIQAEQKLELKKNMIDNLVRDIYNKLFHIQLDRQGSTMPCLSIGHSVEYAPFFSMEKCEERKVYGT